jgi:NCS1 family nucleobase:cation symporter-1
MPFWAAIISFFGVNITVMLNVGDYVRELKPGISDATRASIYFFAMVPATVFMGIIGLMITTATGISNPIVAFSSAVDNKLLVVITLIFIVFAQMTTNLLSNVIPPIYALMDTFKMKHTTAAILVSLLAVCTFPWELVKDTSAAGLDIFIQLYTVFFGPIFAVLFTDYYIVRKQNIVVEELYDDDGPFKGVNYSAILAIITGVAFGFMYRSLSFFISFVPTMLVYYLLMKSMPSSRPLIQNAELSHSE